MEQKINKLYILLIPILIVGISFGYTTFPICLALLIFRLVITDKYSAGFYLIMYGGLVGGVIRTMYPSIPVYGLVLNFIGLFLVRDKIAQFFRCGKSSIVHLLLLYVVFALFYILGPQDDFASTKISNIVQQGLFAIIGYYVLCSTIDIKSESILQVIFMSTLLMFVFVIQFYKFSVGSLFDYEWFRAAEYSYFASTGFEAGTLVSYQHISMNMLYGFAIFMACNKMDLTKVCLYSLCTSQLILLSGCRQAIVGLVLVLLLKFTIFSEYNKILKTFIGKFVVTLIVGLFFIIVLYNFLISLDVSFINDTLSEGDAGRDSRFALGMLVFTNHPILGSGLGGFHYITHENYPHNFFVEILCECGIVGAFVFGSIILSTIRNANLSLKYLSESNLYLFLILSALFVRILVSADFTVSVELFSALFATLAFEEGNSSNKSLGLNNM